MKRTMCMAAAFVCAAAFSAHAQSPAAAMKSSNADKSSDQITVTGCLQSGSSSSAAAGNTMGSYVLMTSVMSGSSATAGTSGTTAAGTPATAGTAGTTESGTMTGSGKMAHPGASYMLDGKDSELKNHVGHRIEVTGSVAGSMSDMNHGIDAAASGKTANANQTLKVASIKMISADCSAK